MIPVEVAQQRILAPIEPLPAIELPLVDCAGCVLARDTHSPGDLPAFASSAMDGFAVQAADTLSASQSQPTFLALVGRSVMGRRPDVSVGPGQAVAIATGAPMPHGADAVIPIEECHANEDTVQALAPIAAGRHVRPVGEDVRSGELLVPAGRRLTGGELGLLAAAGFGRVSVHPRPRVVVFSTGDELVEPGKPLEFGQVHDSNAYTLAGALKDAGAQPFLAGHIRDDPDALRETVLEHSATADAFISTGGVSVGEHDPVKAAFRDRGEIDFFRVAMQPGMPQGFGLVEGKPYFGLPGNPVSVFVSFEVFVRPALMKMMARPLHRPYLMARLAEGLSGPEHKTVFARVLVRRTSDAFLAEPTGGKGSNLISTVARANGLAIIPPGVADLAAGQEVRVLMFRAVED
jgi:molybdopterin molybdotransferase